MGGTLGERRSQASRLRGSTPTGSNQVRAPSTGTLSWASVSVSGWAGPFQLQALQTLLLDRHDPPGAPNPGTSSAQLDTSLAASQEGDLETPVQEPSGILRPTVDLWGDTRCESSLTRPCPEVLQGSIEN